MTSISTAALASDSHENFLAHFISGRYHLIGKALNSQETYYGKATLTTHKKNKLVIQKIIAGKTIVGSDAIEKTSLSNAFVLRIRFSEKNKPFEETCMISSDLDNQARITCYLYQPDVSTKNPGFEAYFVDHD